MSKHARNFYSMAVPHPQLPGAYLSSFGIPGHQAEWVMEGGAQKIFTQPELAENAGYRLMMMKLNRAGLVQTPKMRNEGRIRVSAPDRSQVKEIQKIESKNDADKVFSNFRKTITVNKS